MRRQELIDSTRQVLERIQKECEPESALPEDIRSELLDLSRNGRFIQEDGIADGIDEFLTAGGAAGTGDTAGWLEELFNLHGVLNDVPGAPSPDAAGIVIDFEDDLDELLHLCGEELQILNESVLRGEKVYTLRFGSADRDGRILDWLEQACTVISYRRNHATQRTAFLVTVSGDTDTGDLLGKAPERVERVRERDGAGILRPAQRIGLARELNSIHERIEINDLELLRLYIDELSATTDLPWLQNFVVQLSSVTTRMFERPLTETMRRVREIVAAGVDSPKARLEVSLEETAFTLSSATSTLIEDFLGGVLSAVVVLEVEEPLALTVSARASGSLAEISMVLGGGAVVPEELRKLADSPYLQEGAERLKRALGAEVALFPEERPEVFLSITVAPDPRLIEVMIVEDEGERKSVPVAPIERVFQIGSGMVHRDSFGKVLVRSGNLFLPLLTSTGIPVGADAATGKTCLLFRKISGLVAVTVEGTVGTEMALRSESGDGTPVATIIRTGEQIPFIIPE